MGAVGMAGGEAKAQPGVRRGVALGAECQLGKGTQVAQQAQLKPQDGFGGGQAVAQVVQRGAQQLIELGRFLRRLRDAPQQVAEVAGGGDAAPVVAQFLA